MSSDKETYSTGEIREILKSLEKSNKEVKDLKSENFRLKSKIDDLDDELDGLKEDVITLESELYTPDKSVTISLQDKRTITDDMKIEFLQENWSSISLEKLESMKK